LRKADTRTALISAPALHGGADLCNHPASLEGRAHCCAALIDASCPTASARQPL
jgi:hypothetical protein